jgi:hypothetical protein
MTRRPIGGRCFIRGHRRLIIHHNRIESAHRDDVQDVVVRLIQFHRRPTVRDYLSKALKAEVPNMLRGGHRKGEGGANLCHVVLVPASRIVRVNPGLPELHYVGSAQLRAMRMMVACAPVFYRTAWVESPSMLGSMPSQMMLSSRSISASTSLIETPLNSALGPSLTLHLEVRAYKLTQRSINPVTFLSLSFLCAFFLSQTFDLTV